MPKKQREKETVPTEPETLDEAMEIDNENEEENDEPENKPEKGKAEREVLRAIADEGFVDDKEDEEGESDLRN